MVGSNGGVGGGDFGDGAVLCCRCGASHVVLNFVSCFLQRSATG